MNYPNWVQEVKDMEWYVYYDDFNAGKIIKWNIFKHYSFDKDVEKLLKRKLSKDEFSEELRRTLMYYMWSKCEYEVIVTQQHGDGYAKIDIYDQLRMNWNRFVDYVWSFKKEK